MSSKAEIIKCVLVSVLFLYCYELKTKSSVIGFLKLCIQSTKSPTCVKKKKKTLHQAPKGFHQRTYLYGSGWTRRKFKIKEGIFFLFDVGV